MSGIALTALTVPACDWPTDAPDPGGFHVIDLGAAREAAEIDSMGQVFGVLQTYCEYRAESIRLTARGENARAGVLGLLADRMFARLPAWARW